MGAKYSGGGTVAGVVFVFFALMAFAVGGIFWVVRDMAADREASARAEASADVSRAQIAADLELAVAEAEASAEEAKAAASVERERIGWQGRIDELVERHDHEIATMRETQAEYEKRLTLLTVVIEGLSEDDANRVLAALGENVEPTPASPLFAIVIAGCAFAMLGLSFLALFLLALRFVRRAFANFLENSWPEPYSGG